MDIFKDHFIGKLVLVTGAGKGLGLAISEALHQLGATVYAVSRTQSDLDDLVRRFPGIQAVQLDVQDWDRTREVLNKIPAVDVLVNNAGILGGPLEFMGITSAGFDEITNTNLKSVVNVSQIFAAKMMETKRGGVIINISSVGAIKAVPSLSIYCALKAALDSFTKTMAVELGPYGIRVVSTNFGYINTAMLMKFVKTEDALEQFVESKRHLFPLGKVLVPVEEAVMSVLFAASGIVSSMTGSTFLVDNGYCIV